MHSALDLSLITQKKMERRRWRRRKKEEKERGKVKEEEEEEEGGGDRCQWLMPVILATKEAEIRRITV
jgi:hypothetical protein